jgi:hypothetical protein
MNLVKHLIFTFVIVLGLSMAVSAQKQDRGGKQRPKETPPVVTPAEKTRPKENPPKNNNGGGRSGRGGRGPGMAFVVPASQLSTEVI